MSPIVRILANICGTPNEQKNSTRFIEKANTINAKNVGIVNGELTMSFILFIVLFLLLKSPTLHSSSPPDLMKSYMKYPPDANAKKIAAIITYSV